MCKEQFFMAKQISAAYGKKEVIHAVSFSLQVHTLTAFVGANGSGKSTLMRCITNQLQHKGECFLGDNKLEKLSIKELARKVSYIPQRSGLSISLPVLDVVMMGFNAKLKPMQRPTKMQEECAKNAIAAVGLGGYENTDYMTLSEGQKQLVSLARTLVEDTQLLLLDEPDSALDLKNRYQMMKRLKDMVRENECAGILCLHDPDLALRYCDQLVLLKEGHCLGIVHPFVDDVENMENSLKQIYGSISLVKCYDKKGNGHLTVLWDE